jgi:hypothetical protein
VNQRLADRLLGERLWREREGDAHAGETDDSTSGGVTDTRP